MHRKKWRRVRGQRPTFVFTQETLQLTLRAIALFEQPLQRADHARAKVVFAAETVQGLRQKLQHMHQAVNDICLTAFDYNEKVIIRHALLLYRLLLLERLPTPQQEREVQQCRRIARYFSA